MSGFLGAVRADLGRCTDLGTLSARRMFSTLRGEIGLQALLVYRFGRLLRAAARRPLVWPLLPIGWLLYAMAAELVRECYDIRLELSADIGPGFWIGHFGGIELAHCQLGERCTVGQHTKVGRRGDVAQPRIGSGVWIGAHAAIYGNLRIGDGGPSHRVRASSRTSPVGLWSSGTPAVSPCAATTTAQSSAQVESRARGRRDQPPAQQQWDPCYPAQGEAKVH